MSFLEKVVGIFRKEHEIAAMEYSKNAKMVIGSLLGALAAILQSAGLIGGIGYAFSIMATGPIILATIISMRFGILAYAVTALLLVILQPSEVLVFLFTTGLLGVALGVGFRLVKSKTSVTFTGGLALTAGIAILLYLFHFPVLGPSISNNVSGEVLVGILLFGLFYSWLWMRLSIVGMKQLNKVKVGRVLLKKE